MGAGVALATRFGNVLFTTVGYAAFLPPSADDNGVSFGQASKATPFLGGYVGGLAVLARMPSG
jgi:hypothetical protein